MAKKKQITADDMPANTIGVVLESLARRVSLELAGLRNQVGDVNEERTAMASEIASLKVELADLRANNEALKAQQEPMQGLASEAIGLAIRCKGRSPTYAQSHDLIEAAIRFALSLDPNLKESTCATPVETK